jgi:hypothetical protein
LTLSLIDLHPLALEDIFHTRSQTRSKADYFAKHLFLRILCHELGLATPSGDFVAESAAFGSTLASLDSDDDGDEFTRSDSPEPFTSADEDQLHEKDDLELGIGGGGDVEKARQSRRSKGAGSSRSKSGKKDKTKRPGGLRETSRHSMWFAPGSLSQSRSLSDTPSSVEGVPVSGCFIFAEYNEYLTVALQTVNAGEKRRLEEVALEELKNLVCPCEPSPTAET